MESSSSVEKEVSQRSPRKLVEVKQVLPMLLNSSAMDNKRMPIKDDQNQNDKTRIAFLNQCKLELSAEVIRWKEESLKLRKENEAAVKKIEELQSTTNKLSRQNRELESSLFLSWEENKRLRMRTLAVGEENCLLQEKLSKTKFYSFPWTELKKRTHSEFDKTELSLEKAYSPTESWEEVSRKLFQQMKQEMSEVQKFGLSLTAQNMNSEEEKKTTSVSAGSARKEDHENMDDMEKAIIKVSELTFETDLLKQHLQLQNEKLKLLLTNDNRQNKASYCDTRSVVLKNNNETDGLDEGKQFKRPSDETFRAYFTQQLRNSKSSEDIRRIMQLYLDREGAKSNRGQSCAVQKEAKLSSIELGDPSCQVSSVPIKRVCTTKIALSHVNHIPEQKICPICESVFSKTIPDKEFEAHVIAHLEVVSASLIDQYGII